MQTQAAVSRITFTSIITILFIFNAESYPITPRPLRKLIEESEYIVVVHIRDLKELKSSEDYPREAVLDVREVLQGIVKESVIYVKYNADYICPAPPHFKKDADAIVFLDKRHGEFAVHALSYGVKLLTTAQIEVYKERILEMQNILKTVDRDQKFLETTEWLVKCAENPATRYEGVYELSPGSNFMSYYDRDEKQPFEFTLSDNQKLRLKNALIATTSDSYDDFGLVDLVYARYTKDVFPYLLDRIRHLEDNHLWYADGYMNRINLYKSTERSKELVDQFNKYQFDFQKKAELKKIVTEFIEEIEKLQ